MSKDLSKLAKIENSASAEGSNCDELIRKKLLQGFEMKTLIVMGSSYTICLATTLAQKQKRYRGKFCKPNLGTNEAYRRVLVFVDFLTSLG